MGLNPGHSPLDSLYDHCRFDRSETSTTDIRHHTRLCTALVPTVVTPFPPSPAKGDA
jgi:hypothetical protein